MISLAAAWLTDRFAVSPGAATRPFGAAVLPRQPRARPGTLRNSLGCASVSSGFPNLATRSEPRSGCGRLRVRSPRRPLPPVAFSLIEVIISIAILSGGLLGAIRVFPVGLRASQRAELVSLATLEAERAMESVKLTPWEELEKGESTSEEGGFEVTVKVDQPSVEGLMDPSRLKRVAVTVGWRQEGRGRSLTVVTYVHRQ